MSAGSRSCSAFPWEVATEKRGRRRKGRHWRTLDRVRRCQGRSGVQAPRADAVERYEYRGVDGALMMNAAGAGPGYLMPQGESGVIPVPPHGVAGKTR